MSASPLLQIHTGFRPGDLIFAKVDRSEVIFLPACEDPYRFLIAHDGSLWGIARQLELPTNPPPNILLTFNTQEEAQQALTEILDALLEPVSTLASSEVLPTEVTKKGLGKGATTERRTLKILGIGAVVVGLLVAGAWWYNHSDEEVSSVKPSVSAPVSTPATTPVNTQPLPPVNIPAVPYQAPASPVQNLPGTPGDALMQQMGTAPASQPTPLSQEQPSTQNPEDAPASAGDALLQQMK